MSKRANPLNTRVLGSIQITTYTGQDFPPGGYLFAPGAIEHHRRQLATPAQWSALRLWAKRVAALLATVAAIAFAAGYIAGALRLA